MSNHSIAVQKIVGEEVSYAVNGIVHKSYIAFDANLSGKRPGIVVVPEWWGISEYTKRRARMLAELGYIAIATDMYGEGKLASDPKTAREYAMAFYGNPNAGNEQIEVAIKKLKEYPQCDESKIAAIGYCFGGSMVLNAARSGMELKGVVSFHGGLNGVKAKKDLVKAKVLVCHGMDDKTVSADDLKNFKDNMQEANAPYYFIEYPHATHAFTNPESTENGKKFNLPIAYNAEADKKSWEDMKRFFKEIF